RLGVHARTRRSDPRATASAKATQAALRAGGSWLVAGSNLRALALRSDLHGAGHPRCRLAQNAAAGSAAHETRTRRPRALAHRDWNSWLAGGDPHGQRGHVHLEAVA